MNNPSSFNPKEVKLEYNPTAQSFSASSDNSTEVVQPNPTVVIHPVYTPQPTPTPPSLPCELNQVTRFPFPYDI